LWRFHFFLVQTRNTKKQKKLSKLWTQTECEKSSTNKILIPKSKPLDGTHCTKPQATTQRWSMSDALYQWPQNTFLRECLIFKEIKKEKNRWRSLQALPTWRTQKSENETATARANVFSKVFSHALWWKNVNRKNGNITSLFLDRKSKDWILAHGFHPCWL
jgi:hypothetical protein